MRQGAVTRACETEASLGVQLFRRFHRGLLLTAEGESYLPLISNAFRAISDATELIAPALKGRLLRLGISRALSERRHPGIERLRRGSAWPRTKLTTTDDLSKLIDGKLDVLLRVSPQSPPGLHADRIVLPAASGAALPATLVTLPGLATCREVRALVKLLTHA